MNVQIDATPMLDQERLRSLRLMGNLLGCVAPVPGSLVYIDTQQLLEPWQDFYPSVFTAFDVATHLQVGNIYLLRNTASAVDFLRVIQSSFPFRIREVRTPDSDLFVSSPPSPSIHVFTQVAKSLGISHSVFSPDESDPIASLTMLYGIHGMLRKKLDEFEADEIVNEFVEYLSLHNDRPLPTLNGLTPMEKLRSFSDYSTVKQLQIQLQ